jgi:hypothetical protein
MKVDNYSPLPLVAPTWQWIVFTVVIIALCFIANDALPFVAALLSWKFFIGAAARGVGEKKNVQ